MAANMEREIMASGVFGIEQPDPMASTHTLTDSNGPTEAAPATRANKSRDFIVQILKLGPIKKVPQLVCSL